MSTEICKLCGEEATPWYHINGHICQDCYCMGLENYKYQWISVKDELPEISEDVLVINKDDEDKIMYVSHLNHSNYWISDGAHQYCGCECIGLDNVTHWMRLPRPPSES